MASSDSLNSPFQTAFDFVSVESVQELALNKPNDIPQRYIRSEEERPSSTPLSSLLKVPVIDMEKLLLPSDNPERRKEMGILSKACIEWGFFQVMTNGIYKSIEHRAVTNKERTRLSIAMFYFPGLDDEVAPASNLVDEEHPSLYEKFKQKEYMYYYTNTKLNGKKPLANFSKMCE
ncbi:hypothetical protein SUGI_0483870 [Cryptomeria japonica]|nr:hypothetical protein SUGI_0483870 [Cryptomeria japonica]